MPSFIPSNFTPRQDDYIVLQSEGIPRDFLDVCVTKEFIEFWTELKEKGLKSGKKSAWFTTYRNRARFKWKKHGQAWEDNRHKRHDSGGLKTDLFSAIGASLKNGGPPSSNRAGQTEIAPSPGRVRETRQPTSLEAYKPKPGPAMSPSEAFDQLRKQGFLK